MCAKDSHALGNTKPPLLLLIEKSIFRMLFNIARGQVRIKKAVQDLVVGLPWEEIEHLGENDIVNTWFKPCTCKGFLYNHRSEESALTHRFIHTTSKRTHVYTCP